jgi:hypothetical protein
VKKRLEYTHHREPQEPTWNTRILPGYAVVAVPETDPLNKPIGKPLYPFHLELLNDKYYIRCLRLNSELYTRSISTDLPVLVALTTAIDLMSRAFLASYEQGNITACHDLAGRLQKAIAVYRDVHDAPQAGTSLLS